MGIRRPLSIESFQLLTTNLELVRAVKMGGMFEVGGEELEYPGDPNGSPENVIQCRCQALYIDLDYQ